MYVFLDKKKDTDIRIPQEHLLELAFESVSSRLSVKIVSLPDKELTDKESLLLFSKEEHPEMFSLCGNLTIFTYKVDLCIADYFFYINEYDEEENPCRLYEGTFTVLHNS